MQGAVNPPALHDAGSWGSPVHEKGWAVRSLISPSQPHHPSTFFTDIAV